MQALPISLFGRRSSKKSNGWFGDGFPELCAAMDGGAQASHGCAEGACLGKLSPNQPYTISRRPAHLTYLSKRRTEHPTKGHTGQKSVSRGQTAKPEHRSDHLWRYPCVYRS